MEQVQNAADAAKPQADAGAQQMAEEKEVAQAEAASISREEFQKVVKQRQDEKKARRELEAKLAEIEKAKAAEQGQYKQLWEDASVKLNEFKSRWMRNEIDKAVIAAAAKAGCVAPQDILAVGKEALDLLVFDESTGHVDGAEAFVEKVKQAKTYMFQQPKTPTINPSIPGGGASITAGSGREDYSKLSTDDIKKRLVDLVRTK